MHQSGLLRAAKEESVNYPLKSWDRSRVRTVWNRTLVWRVIKKKCISQGSSLPLSMTAFDALAELRTKVGQRAHTRFVQLAKSPEHIYRTWAAAALYVSLLQWTVPSVEAHGIVGRVRMHTEHKPAIWRGDYMFIHVCKRMCLSSTSVCTHT